ncbi:MAG: hypothetical protein WHV44_15410 [Anaerolineales bacterium]
MYTLANDEKSTLVMAYTQNALLRGEVVTKSNVLVSRWLRTDSAPSYLHFINAQVLFFGGGAVKTYRYPEMYLPARELIAFHLAPPAADPLDYEPNEPNRIMVDVTLMVGTFLFKGKVRISAQIDFGSSLEMGRQPWLSFYEVGVSNPFLPQLQMTVPFVLFSPSQVYYGKD